MDVPKDEETLEALEKAISKNSLFLNLDQDERQNICSAMFLAFAKKGEAIIQQGDEGDVFYILQQVRSQVTGHMAYNPPLLGVLWGMDTRVLKI